MSLSAPGAAPVFRMACFERTDGAHTVRKTNETYVDDEGNPFPSTTERYKTTREAQPVVEWTSCGSGTNPAPSLARDILLGNNANAENYRTFAAMPTSNALLIWRLGQGNSGDKATDQQSKDDLMEGLCGVLQCTRPIPHPPQEVEPKLRNPDLGPPRAFLVSQLSDEHFAEITLSTFYCVRLATDRVIAFGVAPWDLPPCRYIGTLRDVEGIEFSNPHVEEMVVQGIRSHISSRQDAIHRLVGANKARWWGGDKAIPYQAFLHDRLIPQVTVQSLDLPARPEIQRGALFRLNIFAPGVFNDDRGQLREVWRQAVLGPADGKVNTMFGKATIAQKAWYCTYCLQICHTVRLCSIMQQPTWFDGARDALEEDDNRLVEAYRKTERERSQREADDLARRVATRGGRGGSRGSRGHGRGGYRGSRGSGRGSQLALPYGRP